MPNPLIDLIACPKCKKGLDHEKKDGSLSCSRCRLRFRVENDIPNMLLKDAEEF